MKKIRNYCKKIKKETEKVLCKVFGKNEPISYYLGLKCKLEKQIEFAVGHDIKTLTTGEIKQLSLGYSFAMYKTLDKILKVYTESSVLEIIKNMDDYNL